MNRHRRKTSGRSNQLPIDLRGTESSARLPSVYSPTNLRVEGILEKFDSSNSIDYQLTVRPKVELTRYQVSMLLDIAVWKACEFGINLVDWIVIEWLFSNLLGSKKVWEVRDIKERRVLISANLVLLATTNSWLNFEEREKLSDSILSYLKDSDLLASRRTIASREDYWKVSKFLSVRAVRLDVFLERESNTTRYSSYTKGYGESSRMGRRQKTRPSSELDGIDTERPEVSLTLKEVPYFLYLNLVEVKRKYSQR